MVTALDPSAARPASTEGSIPERRPARPGTLAPWRAAVVELDPDQEIGHRLETLPGAFLGVSRETFSPGGR